MSKKFQQLTESVSRQKVGGYGSSPLMNKWSKELRLIESALGDNSDPSKLLTTAVLLENTERHLNAVHKHRRMLGGMGALNEATQPSDVSYFKQFAFNNLMAVTPNLIAQDLVSLQPMLSRNGEIRYLRVLYGSTKGRINRGETMFGQYNLGDHPSDATYSSDEVEGEAVGTDTTANLSWTPVVPGTVKGFKADGTIAYRDNGQGGLTNNAGTSAGTIDYGTGAITFLTNPEDGTTFNYIYDNMEVPVNAPEIQVKIVASPIVARSRKLKTLYSFDGAVDLSNDYGITLSSEILSLSTAQLKREIDDEIIKDLNEKATAPGTTFNKHIPDGISLVDHYAGFPAAVIEASNNIWNITQVANASWIIVGADAANIIQAIPRFKSAGVINPKGSHLIGYLDNLPVYKSGALESDDWTVGYRGESLFDAGYVYAPYLPIMTTQLLMDETFTGKQGYTTSYGKKMTNSDFYARNKIVDIDTV